MADLLKGSAIGQLFNSLSNYESMVMTLNHGKTKPLVLRLCNCTDLSKDSGMEQAIMNQWS